jgi:hypothetical protein
MRQYNASPKARAARAAYQREHREYARARYELFQAFMETLKEVPCMDCGGSFPTACMEFDHVSGEKKFQIGNGYSHSALAVLREIEKCELVCANCHRIRTVSRL